MSGKADHQSRLFAWLELFRAPNLLTVPGDPVAGFLLAVSCGFSSGLPRLVPAAVSSVLFYMAGLALNDWADREEDSIHRPSRPIPSGRTPVAAVLAATVVLVTAALFIASLLGRPAAFVATLLMLMILFYNLFTKHVPVLGPMVMGSCRGLSLLLGAAAAGWYPSSVDVVATAAIFLTLYVAALSLIAAGETEGGALGIRRWLPPLVAVLAVPLTLRQAGSKGVIWFLSLMLGFCIWTFVSAARLGPIPTPGTTKRAVAAFIMGLFIFQAAMCSLAPPAGLVAGAVLLFAGPVSMVLARRFYVT